MPEGGQAAILYEMVRASHIEFEGLSKGSWPGEYLEKRVFLVATIVKALRWKYTWMFKQNTEASVVGNESARQRAEKGVKSEILGERWRRWPCMNSA